MIRRTAIPILILALAAPAAAQEAESIGEFGAWTAFTYEQQGNPVCYIASKPTAIKGDRMARGDVFTLVTHRPADKTWGEVSIVAGYTYRKDGSPTVRIGGNSFELFARGDTAWARDEDDPKLVAAMKRGAEMTVAASSSRGADTMDTYSLIGFTKAYEAIDAACKRP